MEAGASRLEKAFVKDVYENIANHFDHTRHSQWMGVKRFLLSLPPNSLLLDVGCGNGKYLVSDHLVKIGCDRSVELCNICNGKGFPVFAADCLALPVTDGRFDAVLSIAVIHHLATEDRRLRAIRNLFQLLRPGGRALIYVWAFEQSRKGESSFYLKRNPSASEIASESNPVVSKDQENRSERVQIGDSLSLPVHDNRTQFLAQDLLVPWTRKDKKSTSDNSDNPERLLRFYHVFKEGELENLCSKIDGCLIRNSFYEQGNWCVELERKV